MATKKKVDLKELSQEELIVLLEKKDKQLAKEKATSANLKARVRSLEDTQKKIPVIRN